MDLSSPSKRRKTSPTSAVGVNVSNTPSLTPGHNGETSTLNRASYLSPTKASLSRFNPDLVARPQAAANGGPKRATRSSRNPTVGRPRSAHGDVDHTVAIGKLPRPTTPGARHDDVQDAGEKPPTNGAGAATPWRTTQALGGGLSIAPRRLSRTPGRASSAAPTSKAGPDADIAASPPETVQETPDVAQEVIDGQLEQELQGSAGKPSIRNSQARDRIEVHASADQGEPELPPTPTQLGLEAPPEPPRGLFNSPSRRPPRRKASGVKSSPLKPRDPPKDGPPTTQRRTSSRIQGMMKQPEQQSEAKVEMSEEVLRKQRLRDELRAHLHRLQEDVQICEREIERVREPGVYPVPDEETLRQLTFILANEDVYPPKPPLPEPPTLSQILCGFLPFSRQTTVHLPRPPLSILPDTSLPSHLPLDLEDPLPYLKVFTPLDFTSTSTILSVPDDSHDLLQRHDISITAPQNLLQLKLNLTVNTTTHTAHNLAIQSLSQWAKVELGSWIHERVNGDGPTAKDISGVCWATCRYWELSEKRARCWARCYAEFQELLGGEATSNGEGVKSGKADLSSYRRPAKRHKTHGWDPDNRSSTSSNEDHDDDEETANPSPLPRHILAQHLGRQSLLFQHPSIKALSLLITWRIAFDWTGEAESHLQAVSAVPGSWKEADERGSLGKVGVVFEDLVEKLGVLGAVRGVVGLLFKDV